MIAVTKWLTMQGFIVIDYMDVMPTFIPEMVRWIAEGKIKRRETVVKGLSTAHVLFWACSVGRIQRKIAVRAAVLDWLDNSSIFGQKSTSGRTKPDQACRGETAAR